MLTKVFKFSKAVPDRINSGFDNCTPLKMKKKKTFARYTTVRLELNVIYVRSK